MEGFLNFGGWQDGEPDCTFFETAAPVICWMRAGPSGLFGNLFNGGSWEGSNFGIIDLGGAINDNASCTSQAVGELVCGVIASQANNTFAAQVYNGSSWSGWGNYGGAGVGSPSCAPLGTGQAVCIFVGTNNKLSSIVGP